MHEFGGSWKRLYFELYIRDCIETFQPTNDEAIPEKFKILLSEVQLGAPFIQALHLRQLRPIEPRAPFNTQHAEKLQDKSDLEIIMKDISPDHVDFSLIISKLINLKNFSAYFGYVFIC